MVRLFAGRAGSGKTETIINEIIRMTTEDPFGPPIFYIVPDQVTFYMERELTRRSHGQALVRAQVMSFRRFSWRGLQLLGKLPLQPISKNGKFALLASVYEEVSGRLQILGREKPSPQFIERLLQMIEEFQMALPNLEGNQELITAISDNSTVRAKMQDVSILLEAYEHALQGRFIDPMHLMPLFAKSLHEFSSLPLGEIYVDGFLGFTAQEFALLGEIFACVPHLTIVLTMPFDRAQQLDHVGFLTNYELDSPFAQADDTFLRLRNLASRKQCEFQVCGESNETTWRFANSPRISCVEQSVMALQAQNERPFAANGAPGDFVITVASTRRAEVLGVIRELLRLHYEERMPWRDFTLMVTDMDSYRPLLQEAFQQTRIPVFMDEKRPLHHHPLARFILGALQLIESNLASHAVIEWLKTDLIPLSRYQVDQLENYVLAQGVEGAAWWNPFEYSSMRRNSERIQTVREQIVSWLAPFHQTFTEPCKTMRSMISALWSLLEKLEVPQQVAMWVQRENDDGNPLGAQEHEQAMKGIITLFDDLVAAFSDRRLSVAHVIALFNQAFASTSVGGIPLMLDQVVIVDVSRVRAYEVQVAFILGCNDGLLPRRMTQDELISDEERKTLVEMGFLINPESAKQQVYERYRVYIAMTRAKRKLILSYALGDASGRSLAPSVLIGQLKARFSPQQIREENEYDRPIMDDLVDQKLCITEELAASHLTSVLRDVKKTLEMTPLWHAVYELFANGALSPIVLLPKLRGLAYSIDSELLPSGIAQRLFHNAQVGSVSRLERFAACPFSHFSKYGLGLREREELDVDLLVRGRLIHDVLHQFVVYMKEHGIAWSTLSQGDALDLLNHVFSQILASSDHSVWTRNARYVNYSEQVRQALQRAIVTFTEHAERSAFQVQLTEEEFEFELPGATGVRLKGRIDRLDTAQHEGSSYYRIIDYKSSERSVKLDQVYFGLAIQLILYAQVVEQHSVDLLGIPHEFAGVFYYPVRDPMKLVETPTLDHEVERMKRKSVRIKGLLLRDPNIAPLLDRENAVVDDLYPTLLKKDGEYRATIQTVSLTEWEALKDHVNDLASGFLEQIRQGVTEIAPYRLGTQTACQLCSYQGLCQFEQAGGLGTYRELPKLKGEVILEQLLHDRGEEVR